MTMAVCDHVERVPFASPFRGEVKGDTATLSIQPYRDLYKKLGERTWALFWWQIGTLGVGIVFTVLAVWASLSQKLL